MGLLSRKTTCNTHGQDSSYFLGWEEYEKNPYDEIQNPKGIIQMGLAENQVCTCETLFISLEYSNMLIQVNLNIDKT